MSQQSKPVLINLLATARYDQAPDYPIQFMTRGNLSFSGDGEAVIEYTESLQDEDTGENLNAHVSLLMKNGRVTMTRHGDISNTMVFIPKQRFEGVYQTPYGAMDMAVFSRGVRCDIGDRKGSVHLKYQLDIQGAYASSNELHLEYTESESENVQ